MWPANRAVTPQHVPSTISPNDERNIDLEGGFSDDGKIGSRTEADSVLEEILSDDVTSEPQPEPESLTEIETFDMVMVYDSRFYPGYLKPLSMKNYMYIKNVFHFRMLFLNLWRRIKLKNFMTNSPI